MLYIQVENGRPVKISTEHPGCGDHWVKNGTALSKAAGWMSSRDFSSFSDAKTMAAYLTAFTAKRHLAADEGPSTWPRYRVIEAPTVGDVVSRSFNGDSYPCGTITKITPTWQITTSDGTKFRRFKDTGGWRETGRGFWMIHGEHNDRNPHF